ncbi:MAG: PKD domain-containing protein [Caldilineaceae bacterium]
MAKKFMLGVFGLLCLGLALFSYWSGAPVVKASEDTQFRSPLPTPVAAFYVDPYEPSIYDMVRFWDASYDPLGQGLVAWTWNFGDGGTATESLTTHQYKQDGDYTVRHTVKAADGRTGSITRVLTVRTHDIAITKFARPQDGRVGDVRTLVIGISNKFHAETVHVDLYKSVPGGYDGFAPIGYSEQFVPVQKNNKTTDFLFSYTFTPDDGRIGKVSFKAIAWIVNARDGWPADNAYITQSVNVRPSKGSGYSIQESDSDAMVDDVADGNAIPVALPDNVQSYRSYMPLVASQK